MTSIEGPLIPDPAGGWHCRTGCGACCIALSISSPIPGLPGGKPAGMRCLHLTDDNRCAIFTSPDRPEVCARLRPEPAMCGSSREHALRWIAELEAMTAPVGGDRDRPR